MPLSQFTSTMPAAVSAVIRVANALRYIRDTSGDLTYSILFEVQDALKESKTTTYAALTEGAKAPVAAESFMAGLGGPATLADYQAAAMDIEAKASAWNDLLSNTLASLPAGSVIGLITLDVSGISTRHIEYKSFIPAQYANTLRTSQVLVDLINAFEIVGA